MKSIGMEDIYLFHLLALNMEKFKWFNYTISKNALDFFHTKYKNLAEYNIFNNIICGITNTSILNNKKVLKARIKKVPVKRIAKIIELA